MWRDESHDNRNHTGKADDALTHETGGVTGPPVSPSSFVRSWATTWVTVVRIANQLGTAPSRCAAESPKGELPDTWPGATT